MDNNDTANKVRLGLACHVSRSGRRRCKSCPYYVDEQLDPRTDPFYNANVINQVKKCRDDLLADVTKIMMEDER